ncbi:hypothetical protein HPB52_013489 [Rhipicephalus sanguineus]|uniref:Peptidase M13 C-terminal domain-containing protein n=1 Tax=Rhipicephalus sanguineus TaxID=34632 RepID=A0A9D4PDK9_RHISA|nr:hypothetical protein HPB52_013489 [Rhipicephalus sanguineus]
MSSARGSVAARKSQGDVAFKDVDKKTDVDTTDRVEEPESDDEFSPSVLRAGVFRTSKAQWRRYSKCVVAGGMAALLVCLAIPAGIRSYVGCQSPNCENWLEEMSYSIDATKKPCDNFTTTCADATQAPRELPPQLITRIIDLDSRFLAVTLTADDRMIVKNKFILPFISEIVLGEHSGSETVAGYVAFLVALQLAPAMSGSRQFVVRLLMCLIVPKPAAVVAMVDLFVDWFVENDKLAAIRAMSAALWKATESIITDLSWIDETTRKKGLEHIRRLGRVVGHPGTARTLRRAEASASHADMFTTVHDAHARRRLELLKGTKPSVRQEDLSSDDLVNASTCHSTGSHGRHHVRPFYTLTVPESVNYGALGHVVGHEVTHSYDPVLGVFKRIRLKDDWWSPKSREVRQAHPVLARPLQRGPVVIRRQNFADCGGLEKVMRALRELGPQPGVTLGEHSFTAQQAFFVSSCFKWCAKYVPKPAAGEQPDDIAKIYSPLNMRCNVPLMNTAFADAFGCAPGTIMSPKVRCQLF